jgi:iron(III) transport system permease protein
VWILILAFMVARLPFASRSGISSMMQVGGSLEEAAEIHGAGFWTRFRKVLFPLAKRGFLTGFILTFVATVKDLSIVVLLATPQTMMLSALTFGYVDLGQRQFADAIGVVIVTIVLACTFAVQWITKTNPLQGFGGDAK